MTYKRIQRGPFMRYNVSKKKAENNYIFKNKLTIIDVDEWDSVF